jgi:quercetin dioxygenase-like cupin family protein
VINPGDTIANPVTGERMTFLTTSRQTQGEHCLVEVTVEPNGSVASPHLHPKQTERFEILDGEVEFRVGRETIIARRGDVVVVEPGTAHRFRNVGDTIARFTCEVRPALQFEQLLETMFALAADGKTNRKGLPRPLRLAVIAGAHFDDVRLPFPPVWVQRAGLALGAPVGRLLGFTPTYVPTTAAATPLPA